MFKLSRELRQEGGVSLETWGEAPWKPRPPTPWTPAVLGFFSSLLRATSHTVPLLLLLLFFHLEKASRNVSAASVRRPFKNVQVDETFQLTDAFFFCLLKIFIHLMWKFTSKTKYLREFLQMISEKHKQTRQQRARRAAGWGCSLTVMCLHHL